MKARNLPLLVKVQLWLAGFLCLVQLAEADTINLLTPPGSDKVEGNTQVTWEEYSSRFQQVFDASLFKSIMPQGGWIQSVYLRADGPTVPPHAGILSGAEISLSTTTKAVDSLSPVFADNIGSDVKVLLSRSQRIDFSASGINANGVRSYGPEFDYDPSAFPPSDSTFFYDPSKGNLLMDFKDVSPTRGGGQSSLLSLDGVVSPAMSSVFSDFTHGGGPISGTLSSKGLVMLFQVTPVPEPSGLVLCGLGIIGITLLNHCRSNRKHSNVTL